MLLIPCWELHFNLVVDSAAFVISNPYGRIPNTHLRRLLSVLKTPSKGKKKVIEEDEEEETISSSSEGDDDNDSASENFSGYRIKKGGRKRNDAAENGQVTDLEHRDAIQAANVGFLRILSQAKNLIFATVALLIASTSSILIMWA